MDGVLSEFGEGKGGGSETRDGSKAGVNVEEIGVGFGPMVEFFEGAFKKEVMGYRSMWGGVKSEVSEGIPGLGGDPGVFGFVLLGADEASRVSDAKGSDGADISEDGIVNRFWDEAVSDVFLEVVRLWKKDGGRDFEGDLVNRGIEGGGVTSDEDGVNGTPGVEDGDGQSLATTDDHGGLKPLDGGFRLGVGMSRVVFKMILKFVTGEVHSVEFWVEGDVSKGRLGGDYKGSVNSLDVRGLEEEVKNLGGLEVHEGVVHENGGSGWEVRGGLGVAGFITGS